MRGYGNGWQKGTAEQLNVDATGIRRPRRRLTVKEAPVLELGFPKETERSCRWGHAGALVELAGGRVLPADRRQPGQGVKLEAMKLGGPAAQTREPR
jgi:hypothetical protein